MFIKYYLITFCNLEIILHQIPMELDSTLNLFPKVVFSAAQKIFPSKPTCKKKHLPAKHDNSVAVTLSPGGKRSTGKGEGDEGRQDDQGSGGVHQGGGEGGR